MPLPKRVGGLRVEWSDQFFFLSASATVKEALARLAAERLPFVLVMRLPNYWYVYRSAELRSILRHANRTARIEQALGLHEFLASQPVTVASVGKVKPVRSPVENLTAARFYVIEPSTRTPVRVGVPDLPSDWHGVKKPRMGRNPSIPQPDAAAPPPPSPNGGKQARRLEPEAKPRTKNGGHRRARPVKKALRKSRGRRLAKKSVRQRPASAWPRTTSTRELRRKPRTRGKARESSAPPRAVVSTGFAGDELARPLSSTTPLRAGERYYFWLEIGERVAGAIDEEAVAAPQQPVGARLRVVVFAFPSGFTITRGDERGELEVTEASGAARVVSTPSVALLRSAGTGPDMHDLLARRLFFRLRAPRTSGIARLRCNIYHGQTLLQSRLVEAKVTKRVRRTPGALRTVLDYTISHTMDPDRLRRLPPYALSVLANEAGGTHAFWVVGSDWKRQATFTEAQITKMLVRSRGVLREVAWKSKKAWDGKAAYRYTTTVPRSEFIADLIALAVSGYKLYAKIINRFAGPRPKEKDLAAAMRTPGFVQIAITDAAYLLPAALLYDRPLSTSLDDAQYKLCPDFLQALDQQVDLATHRCFVGDCRWNDKACVCPSGFWGFRHNLGLPLNVADAPEAPTAIEYRGPLELRVALSTALKQTETHLTELRAFGTAWEVASTRTAVLALLRKGAPQLVYFYCHGGVRGDQAYLQVGDPKHEYAITPDELISEDILWERSRPLVFLNGCETVAVEPALLLDLASAFVLAHAGGVIGTETTVFEPLATVFAQECLREFLVNGRSIGEAVRLARLALLRAGNPMGLVYTPFILPSVKLVAKN
jgi:hypothetical protein